MVEVTIVASGSNFMEGEQERLQQRVNGWLSNGKCIHEIMHYLGKEEDLSVSIYGDYESGFTMKCHKVA